MPEEIIVFHNGSKREGGFFLTNGGRVLSITCLGEIKEARENIYRSIKILDFEGLSYRKDIAELK